ncbi:nSTAND3 domain-containing NTPase [Mesorhizobium sp. BHbsci]
MLNELQPDPLLLAALAPYPLHLLGWKAFQDLCVSVAEECLRRPVQSFLPSNDAGRDGAFVGRWEGDDPAAGESTIQCKFTSRQSLNLTMSSLGEELPKAERLAKKGLAKDYIILTNHGVTGESELAIKAAFEGVGVGRCRVFGGDWITRQVRTSSRLRMMVPRLYGLGSLNDLLDQRAYAQAQLILSAMGDDLQRLVVTESHRRSVRAISEHNLVLLLGAPAAGKSTIGASIAIGAADIWQSNTIRATSPAEVQRHLSPEGGQFFWIDDAWGNTQYQRQRAEDWNQVFPLMNGAIRQGTRFLITSRDYIWKAAKSDLKLASLPVLNKSQVVIDVHELSTPEKAQILYNHIKMGDQPTWFRTLVKPYLPAIAERSDFLPETARRFGSAFFAGGLQPSEHVVTKFFSHPKSFLQETIASMSPDCRAAIAVLFLNGGKVRSPVSSEDLASGAHAFGVTPAETRNQLEALNGSLLLLAQDELGPFWIYKHPTVSDAFSSYLATSPELIEIYLRGANPHSILYEVVCAGVVIGGAPLVVPDALHALLVDRILQVEDHFLRTFLSYRSSPKFSSLIIERRPSVLKGLSIFATPIKSDPDATLLGTLFSQGLLSEGRRQTFVEAAKSALVEDADASFLELPDLRAVFKPDEMEEFLSCARTEVLPRLPEYVEKLRKNWNPEYPPDDHFSELEQSISQLCDVLTPYEYDDTPLIRLKSAVRLAVSKMEDEYQEPSSTSAPVASSTPQATGLQNLFRDVDAE